MRGCVRTTRSFVFGGIFALLVPSALSFGAGIADTVVAGNQQINATEKPLVEAGQECLKRVGEARAFAKSVLQAGSEDREGLNLLTVLETPVRCDVAYDSGCGSAMSGSELYFLTGGPNCGRGIKIPSLVYHEWAHLLNHRLAHVYNQFLDEAFADVFATYLSGDSKFARGIFTDRERTWFRDLSERKIYNGNTKQVYTQSLTLSGAWWDFRTRLIKVFGEKLGAERASEVFLKHLLVIGKSSAHRNGLLAFDQDFNFAFETLSNLNWPADSLQRGACELANAFLDHGFTLGPPLSQCRRVRLATDEDQVFGLLEHAQATGEYAEASVLGRFPQMLPDHATLSVDVDIKADPSAKVRALVLELELSHPYSEDLLIRVTAPDGKTWHDIYKGEEELAVPARVTDRFAFGGVKAEGRWKIEIINSGAGLRVALAQLKFGIVLR